MQDVILRAERCTYQIIHVRHGEHQALVRSQASYAQRLVQDLTTPLPCCLLQTSATLSDTKAEVLDLSLRLPRPRATALIDVAADCQ